MWLGGLQVEPPHVPAMLDGVVGVESQPATVAVAITRRGMANTRAVSTNLLA